MRNKSQFKQPCEFSELYKNPPNWFQIELFQLFKLIKKLYHIFCSIICTKLANTQEKLLPNTANINNKFVKNNCGLGLGFNLSSRFLIHRYALQLC